MKTAFFFAALAVTAVGCASAELPRPETATRQVVPIPVCTKGLAPPKRAAGGKAVMRSLEPEEWLEILVPSYEEKRAFDGRELDCTGHYVFANDALRWGIPVRGSFTEEGKPLTVEPDVEVDVHAGPEGMRVLWMRSLRFENGDIGGPLALVRAIDDRAEIYGVGSFRGPDTTKFEMARVGSEAVVVSQEKRCPDQYNCRKVANFYLARRGRLVQAATADVDRIARIPCVAERGLYCEYKLRTDVTYEPDGIHLLEQVRVKVVPTEAKGDRDGDRMLRTAEFTRVLKVERDSLFSSNESLWERIVGQE